jgi:DNA-binding SARP family transcriptional activator
MSTIDDDVAAGQLQDLGEEVRYILIHPASQGKRFILAHLLQFQPIAYVRLEGENLAYSDLRQQFDNSLYAQTGKNGLVGVQYIILDECERSQPAELTLFLKEIEQQTAQGKIVIFSRTVPDYIYTNPELRAKSRFVPSDDTVLLPDYAHAGSHQKLLEVNALGNGWVSLNGRPVVNWDGTLPRALFFFLIDRGMTTRKQIFETFWPSLTVREATNVFHVTKRKISEVIGFDLTRYWSGFYHISPDIRLSYDVATFSQLVTDSGVASDERAAQLLSRAAAIYKYHFLTSVDMTWANRRREELALASSDVLASLGRLVEKEGNADTALGIYTRASVTNPQREDIARSIMTLYADRNRFDDAEAVYKRLENELDRQLNVEPSKETLDLIGQIRLKADAVA